MQCGSLSAFSWAGKAVPEEEGAIACGKVKFSGQVLPTSHKITYDIQIKRVIQRRLIMGIADGFLSCDGKQIYSAENLEVGLFKK